MSGTWVKLDDLYFLDPKVLGLSHSAKLLYLAGLCHTSNQMADGVITATAMGLLHFQAGSTAQATEELVECGLWTNHVDGYEVANYLKWNRDRRTIEQQRAAQRTRQKRYDQRKRRADASDDASLTRPESVSVSVSVSDEPILRNAVAPLAGMPAAPPDRFDEFWDAFGFKKGRADAVKAWKKSVLKAGVDQQTVIDAAREYAKWRSANPDRAAKWAQGWLSSERWTDEIESAAALSDKRSLSYEERYGSGSLMGTEDGIPFGFVERTSE